MALAIGAVIAGLYFGRDVLVPLALAVLLSLALAPVVQRLQRWRVPRLAAVLAVVVAAILAVAGFGTVVTLQLSDLARQIPDYEHNMLAKIEAVRAATPKGGVIDQLVRVGEDLRKAVGRPAPPPSDQRQQPVLVVVHEGFSPLRLIENVAGPALQPIATFGIVVILVIFMLTQREDLRNRLIRLAGVSDMGRTTVAIDDAVARVGRFLLTQMILNSLFGTLIGLALWAIGLPNPLLWGMITGVMRFVPYIGPIVATTFPLLLAVAVAPGWTMPLVVLVLFVVLETAVSNFIEPLAYGSSTGLAPLSVLAGAILWASLWGPVGLLLATPLNVCLVVLGKHVPALHFLAVILGDAPVLTDEARLYQRLLAGDVEEAAQLCAAFAEGKPPGGLHDGLLLPALLLAEHDRRNGALPSGRQRAVVRTLADVLETPPPEAGPGTVACLPAHGDLDRGLALVLADLLVRQGRRASVPAAGGDIAGDAVLFLCTLDADAQRIARHIRRLRQRFPAAPACLLAPEGESGDDLPAARKPGQAVALVDAGLSVGHGIARQDKR
jgi:predicted PurR-regulated permease PerM